MNILAIETSSKAASCAYSSGGKLIGEFYLNAGLTHSQTIMPMVYSMLSTLNAELSQVDVFAVSVGPGSFTGLRIGIAAVKGMAMAADKPCAAVSTLHCLVLNMRSFAGYVIPVLDARRDQVYTAVFNGGGELNRISEDEALSVKELGKRIEELQGPKILLGDGAKLCWDMFAGMDNLHVAPEQLLYQRASALCEVAIIMAKENRLIRADNLAPDYLRLPQAERELNQLHK